MKVSRLAGFFIFVRFYLKPLFEFEKLVWCRDLQVRFYMKVLRFVCAFCYVLTAIISRSYWFHCGFAMLYPGFHFAGRSVIG